MLWFMIIVTLLDSVCASRHSLPLCVLGAVPLLGHR